MKCVAVILVIAATCCVADWQAAVNLGPPINTESWDNFPSIASDGSYLIFMSNRSGGYGAGDLWVSFYTEETWQEPTNLGANVNTSKPDDTPFLAEGDTKLYYASRNLDGGYGEWDIYWCDISDGVPGASSNVGAAINTADIEYCPVLTPDGNTLYFSSNRAAGGYGEADIWVSEWDGSDWGTPTNLSGVINTDGLDGPAYISDDGTTLVFVSPRDGGFGGLDLWSSVKAGGTWGTPVNLGPEINCSDDENGGAFYSNHGGVGGVIYFGSTRADGGYGDADLWVSTHSDYVNISPASLGEVKATFR